MNSLNSFYAKGWKSVAILGGGSSSERAVSLKSAQAVLSALQKVNISASIIDADPALFRNLSKLAPDVVFNSLHGEYGEDGCIQGILAFLKIPYTGSGVLTSALTFNKIKSKEFLSFLGFPVGKWAGVKSEMTSQDIQATIQHLSHKIVVKPCNGGSSVGISLCEKESLQEALIKAFPIDSNVIIEDYLPGKEFSVPIYNDVAVGVIEILPTKEHPFYDYAAKYEPGGSQHIIPADIDPQLYEQIMTLAEQTHCALGCNFYSRVDFKLDPNGQPIILEINSLPGLTETSLFPEALTKMGTSFEEIILQILLHAN